MKSKLSALEELRLEKARLTNECAEEKEQLLYNLEYTKGNVGRLLINSLFSSTKSGVSDIFSSFSGKDKDSKNSTSGIGSMVMSIAPLIWEMIQPMIITFAFKKVKSVFTRKPKKKKSDM